MTASSAALPIARPLWRDRTLVLAGIVLSAFNLRTAVTSLTPLLDSLGQTLGFGSTMTGVLGMVPTAAFAVFGVATPGIAHRLGLERTALLAMVLATLGLFARAFIGDTWMLLLTSAVALSGMGMGNVVLPPLVKRYFADRVGTVSTLLHHRAAAGHDPAGAARGAAGAQRRLARVAGRLVAAWRPPPRCHGSQCCGWNASAIRARRMRWRRSTTMPSRASDEAPELAKPVAPGRVWRSPVAWGLALMFGMTSLITYSMFTWLPKLLVEAGGSPALGGSMVALFSTLGLLSALVLPALAVRIANPYPIVIACAVAYVAAFTGLLLAPMAAPMLWVALLGLGPSTFPLSLTLINLRTRTPAGSAKLSGFMQGVGYSLSCLGPLLFGLLHELDARLGLAVRVPGPVPGGAAGRRLARVPAADARGHLVRPGLPGRVGCG